MNKIISIIVPCFNEEKTISLFWKEVTALIDNMKYVSFEIIFVDDGSTDKTLDYIKDLADKNINVRYISFSRNFGKEAAMLAGFENAHGDFIALIDCDLQDPPSLIPQMYKVITEDGYDCAATRRTTRTGEPFIRSFLARTFYKIINHMWALEIVDGARDFRFMNRKYLDALLKLKEKNRFSKGLFSWVGFKTKWIEFDNVQRIAGETKWSFWKLFKYSMEGIVSFTTIPLIISSGGGILFCLLSIISTAFIFIRKILYGDPVPGWASTLCVITFLSGIQLFFMGIFGQYMAKIYLEIKARPVYIISDTNIKTK